MIKLKKKILLGSGSPRRKQLLEELGIKFRVLVSQADEIPLPHLEKGDIATFLAEEKSKALITSLRDDEILLTADTIVWLDSSMLGKPNDVNEAFSMIKQLSGRVHQVYSGVCLSNANSIKMFCVESSVIFRELSDEEIRNYISLYKPFDKAGAYGAQEGLPEGKNPCSEKEKLFLKKYNIEDLCERTIIHENKKRIPLIDHIEGSYFNVMGLPIVELAEELLLFE